MAEKRVSVRLAAVGGRQVRAELEGVGEAGARGFGRLSREMEAANARMAAFSRRVKVAAAAAVVAAAAAGVAMVRSGLQTVDAQAKLAQSLGTTVASIQTLERAGELAGVSISGIEQATKDLTRRLSQAAAGSGPAADALDRLGLSATELIALPLDQRVGAINAAIESFVPAAERAAVAGQLFGEEGSIAMSRIDTATLRQAAEDVLAFGVVVTEQDADQIERTNDAISRLGLIWRGLSNQLAVAAAPALEAVANAMAAIASRTGPLGIAIRSLFDNIGRLTTYPQSLPPWEGIDYRYHRMIGTFGGEGGGLTMALVDCLRADSDTQGLGRTGAMALLNSVLEPLGISNNLLVELKEVIEPDTLPSPTRIGDRDYFPLFRRMNEQRNLQLYARINTARPPIVMSDRRRPRNLSSGEVALLRFAAYAVASLRRGSIFLFDEPETHLHPNYISQFMEMLDRLLEQSGSIALIATHSAYVVREVPRRRVRIITRDPDDETIIIDPPTMQTFGASIDTISQFVFGDVGPKHRFQHVIEQYIEKNPEATLRDIRRRFEADLNPETLSYIADLVSRRDEE